ncbi:PLP-dependent aminotransferase family protein [Pantoea sp. 1.19]|uniref:MocR-like pyridoxine biosynthesis transcription factor PdxR n=1 Tax=Pantoea sp. 1.19 TaxID=1925589 RepID=UPI000948ECCF|nr:PLP-dependent aminotransferase family protein [Pantoea sp. 1.19]
MLHHDAALLHAWQQHDAPTRKARLCLTLRALLRQQQLPAGSRLPASRRLASLLSLSRVTVEAAYAQLESEGWLLRHTGRGTFVALQLPAPAPRQGPTDALPLSPRAAALLRQPGCQDPLFPRAFAAGSPDLRAFPLALWQRLGTRSWRLQGDALLRYGDPQGYAPLREALTHYLAEMRGVRCHAGQIMVLTSSQQALHMLGLLLCDAGDRVWLEDPGYAGARQAFLSAGAVVSGLPLDAHGARLPEAADVAGGLAYLTPSHHYPSGCSMSLSRRLAWLEYARQRQIWIIEDDYDSEFCYDGTPLPALQGLDPHGRVIYVGTFSKTLFPSLRLAYLVLPEALVTPLCQLRSVIDGHSAQQPQAVTAAFIAEGHFAAHLRLMRQLYRSRRDLLRQQLAEKLAGELQLLPASGGLQLTAMLPGGGESRLRQQGLEHDLLLPGLSGLSQQPHPPQGLILGYAALRPAEITAAVDRLARLDY